MTTAFVAQAMEMDDESKSRFMACWKHQDCNSCTHDSHGCGWCPSVRASLSSLITNWTCLCSDRRTAYMISKRRD